MFLSTGSKEMQAHQMGELCSWPTLKMFNVEGEKKVKIKIMVGALVQ